MILYIVWLILNIIFFYIQNQPAGISLDDPILLVTPKASQPGTSQTYAFFSPTGDQGLDLGHVNVTELLHSLLDLVFFSLDVHKEHSVLLSSIFFMAGQMMAQACFSWGHSSEDIQVGFRATVSLAIGRWVTCGPSSCVWVVAGGAVDTIQHCFLCLQSLCFGFKRKEQGLPSSLSAPSL